MKRKKRIVTSVIGIVLVLVIIIGISYGYYLTQISGNTSSKSITVRSGESSILFTDLANANYTSDYITPGYSYTKTYTVENTGNIRGEYSLKFTDVSNNFTRTSDIVYTLYKAKYIELN